MRPRLLVTCEHGGNEVPEDLAPRFRGLGALLASHRGFDPNAYDIAYALAEALDAPFFYSRVSRLVVDLNRSIWHPGIFSDAMRGLGDKQLADVLARHYAPYRQAVAEAVEQLSADGSLVVHLSVHSFTPVLDGVERTADAGILYDPARVAESRFAAAAAEALDRRLTLPARHNYPYLGTDDGFTTRLRGLFPESAYAGIELEWSQAVPVEAAVPATVESVAEGLNAVLAPGPAAS